MTAWIFYELYPDHTWQRVVVACDSADPTVARAMYDAQCTPPAPVPGLLVLMLPSLMPADADVWVHFPADRLIVGARGTVVDRA